MDYQKQVNITLGFLILIPFLPNVKLNSRVWALFSSKTIKNHLQPLFKWITRTVSKSMKTQINKYNYTNKEHPDENKRQGRTHLNRQWKKSASCKKKVSWSRKLANLERYWRGLALEKVRERRRIQFSTLGLTKGLCRLFLHWRPQETSLGRCV